MLENRLYQSRLGRAFSAAVLAGTLAFSSPAQADIIPGRGCESAVPGAVEIGYTGYCTDRFGVIYGPEGEEVRNAADLRSIRGLKAYPEAKEAANALYEQLEARRAREAAQPSPLEERAAELAPPRRGPPPPYLRPSLGGGGAPGSPPPSFPSSGGYSPEGASPGGSYSSEKNERNKDNDVFGYILTIGGAGLLGTKLALDFATDPCPEGVQVGGLVKECHRHLETEDYVLYTLFGAALVAGIYLLVD